MISILNRYNLRNQPDVDYVISILNKLDECVNAINDLSNKPIPIDNTVKLIRLGSIIVKHTNRVPTDVIGTVELQNANTYYVPVVDMKIIGAKFVTNIATDDIPSTPFGILKIISASLVNSTIAFQEIVQPINTDFIAVGLNNQAMYDTVSTNNPNMTLKAFESNYAIQVILDASAPTGAYAFEVYIKAEYV
jgi:hypothetical protein